MSDDVEKRFKNFLKTLQKTGNLSHPDFEVVHYCDENSSSRKSVIVPPGSNYLPDDCCVRCCQRRMDAELAEGKLPIRLFIGCTVCGNKRCPKASDHDNSCTGSNEPGQLGSDYE